MKSIMSWFKACFTLGALRVRVVELEKIQHQHQECLRLLLARQRYHVDVDTNGHMRLVRHKRRKV